ncbi:MAG TPA: nicotinate-nucleotide adenylyltransferase [Actinomycetota bacterium]|nr:nicotinate-nucleotide adenylyltransferase [Actinomycetota bacterium]
MRRIGVMGGTFDPIHIGHLVAASEVQHAFGLEQVLFIPAGDPWQKKGTAASEDRYMMVVLGTAGHPGFSVSRIELDRRGPSYTADTVTALRDYFGDVQLFLILGADAANNIGTWRKLDELAGAAEVVAVRRPGVDRHPQALEGWPAMHELDIPALEISGSDIRDRVRRGLPIDFLVPDDVAVYIRTHGLYLDAPRSESA